MFLLPRSKAHSRAYQMQHITLFHELPRPHPRFGAAVYFAHIRAMRLVRLKNSTNELFLISDGVADSISRPQP
jgi:hypothetical protein